MIIAICFLSITSNYSLYGKWLWEKSGRVNRERSWSHLTLLFTHSLQRQEVSSLIIFLCLESHLHFSWSWWWHFQIQGKEKVQDFFTVRQSVAWFICWRTAEVLFIETWTSLILETWFLEIIIVRKRLSLNHCTNQTKQQLICLPGHLAQHQRLQEDLQPCFTKKSSRRRGNLQDFEEWKPMPGKEIERWVWILLFLCFDLWSQRNRETGSCPRSRSSGWQHLISII